jgi:transcriptional regulator with XRE-family HTH domain
MVSGSEQLRDWMRRREVNQREASELLGITDVFLSQILNGHRQPGLANAINIERKAGISVESWLLTDISESTDVETVGASKRKIAKR